MLVAQFLKLLVFILLVYAVISLVRFLIRVGRMADERRRRENIRTQSPGPRGRKGDIELDRDQYKVE